MKITFVDTNPHVVNALVSAFANVSDITIIQGDITNVSGDALVSPANCYGWMDGGIDSVYLYMFGYQLQVRVQAAIAATFNGYLPIGSALSVHTMGFGPQFPKYLIVAPTMETPMFVGDTRNAYLAFKAALSEAIRLKLGHLVCPGLCSLTGGMKPDEMANQMRMAFDEFQLQVRNPHHHSLSPSS
ncbi:phage tail assembly-like protein [Hafnia paralvei ATCC 29927]|uniref:macro domain-containing protein n=1 Tax=Hafnia paralvei TaxID=546367 RepID=UPI0007E4677E|nr:macro domain-containing protein [Hafnia paralvei]OAT41371.1 phage tail assembly-like protein [Hafnia paralvei ATCC 29927]